MDDRLNAVVKAAGIEVHQQPSLQKVFEDYLELGDSIEGPSIEDAEPSEAFLAAFSHLCVYSWKIPMRFLEKEQEFDQLECILAIKWLRHAVDLSVSSRGSLTSLLLSESNNIREELLDSLFYHVQHLPQLQFLINLFHSNLMKRLGKSVASSRLEQFTNIQHTQDRLAKQMNQHLLRLEYILGDWYEAGDVALRSKFRHHLGVLWHSFVNASKNSAGIRENTLATGIAMTLRLLLRIVKGFNPKQQEQQSTHRHLLYYSLIPLHTPDSLVLWRDQAALLELYHEPLVQCIAFLLRRNKQWVGPTISSLIGTDIWHLGNTPKTILLLHEIDTLLKLLDGTPLEYPVWRDLLRQLSTCMASENSRLSEQALQFFRNENFKCIVFGSYGESVPVILKAIVKKGDIPWNPTVRKMCFNVLQELRQHDENKFTLACETVFGSGGNKPISLSTEHSNAPAASGTATVNSARQRASRPPDFSLKADMCGWRPPTQPKHAATRTIQPPLSRSVGRDPPLGVTGVAPWKTKTGGAAPPLTVTGVAPWARKAPSSSSSSSTTTTTTTTANPSLKVTGVAPWANKQSQAPLQPSDNKRSKLGPTLESGKEGSAGLKLVLGYMEQIKPPKEQVGTSSWVKAQMAESPTLLPSLKFHDLVFGHELGSGAFGVVKYARQIDRTRTRSHWPEYAVKIISTQKIVELGYEQSVQREMAVLRNLSHPGIARLISSFRFRDGAYLVLEYASKGDLHGLLRKNGSLNQESTQFVIGEIVVALLSVHEAGFIYGDLKPENVLITEAGHIKLTDFGGSRPYTEEAKKKIRSSSKNLLEELRDGDWKSAPKETEPTNDVELQDWSGRENGTREHDTEGDIAEEEEEEDDLRIEGTVAYLPPEVVLGAIPTTSADVWALGCVLYQCLTGRPPYLEDDDKQTKQKIVSFDNTCESGGLFEGDHANDLQTSAKSLITRLLTRNSRDRPSLTEVCNHDFFSGIDVAILHERPALALDVGNVAPKADAKWARRQFSSIWAPQPKPYDISETPGVETNHPGSVPTAPIEEGDESTSFFSISSKTTATSLGRLEEKET